MPVQAFRVPIFHMASMARSGETLLLRTLESHSRIHVVHNLRKEDSKPEERLFKYLMTYKGKTIWRGDKRLCGVKLRFRQVLLLKQSVWEHPYPYKGFILARNPLSIFASLKYYDVPKGGGNWEAFWKGNTDRFVRWLSDIDPALITGFEKLSAVQQFCSFYNRRMGQLHSSGLPVIYYEKFVVDPQGGLRQILRTLGLAWEDGLLQSHQKYKAGEEGHGKVDLSKPINADSVFKYREMLSERELCEIVERTQEVFTKYGYELGRIEMKINGNAIVT